jgi:hypothetical protein
MLSPATDQSVCLLCALRDVVYYDMYSYSTGVYPWSWYRRSQSIETIVTTSLI